MNTRIRTLTGGAGALLLIVGLAAPVLAASKPTPPPSPATANWSGNGTTWDGTTRALTTTICDANSTPYLYWVLSGSKATSASITIPDGTYNMGKANVDKNGYSTFKYTWTPTSSITLGTLNDGTPSVNGSGVTATYNDAKNKAVLTISKGCLGRAGSPLTITFVGTADWLGTYSGPDGTLTASDFNFVALNVDATAQFCEAGSTTNCVSFAGGTAASTSQTLTLSGPMKNLVVTAIPLCNVSVWANAPTAMDAYGLTTPVTSLLDVFGTPATGSGWQFSQPVTGTTSSTWSNGQTLYWTDTTICY